MPLLRQQHEVLYFAIFCTYVFCIILKLKMNILPSIVKGLVFVMDMMNVFCEVDAEFLCRRI